MKRPAIVRLFSGVTLALGGWALTAVGCGVEPVDRNAQADVEHVGEAEQAVGVGFSCSRDHDVYCDAGLSCCPGMYAWGTCRSLQDDEQHCGTCSNACSAGQICSSGHCCASDKFWCEADSRCMGTNEGACRDYCANGCATGTTCCTWCVDVQTDEQNCGTCGLVCGSGKQCLGGSCVPICIPGKTSCSGICVNLQTDEDNCGACDVECASGEFCLAGVCEEL